MSDGFDAAAHAAKSPQILRPSERVRLERGLPDLRDWGENLLEPFVVRRLRHAQVIWLNKRWFAERGFDANDVREERRILNWLLSEYAFVVKDPRDPESSFSDEQRLAGADRYGSTPGGSPAGGGHGGSGRTGTMGKFQVKGIGVTPLVGVNAKWDHAQGWAGLEEALTEAIMGEVVCEEFPYGGVPVIAVIDTGLFQHPPSSAPNSYRRALIIRPAVLRPAHMQRAPLFLESIQGTVQNPQLDVARTRQFIARFQGMLPSERRRLQLPSNLENMAKRLAAQAAFGDVNRLFAGGMFSSNMSLTGMILDYGAMRALESWAKVSVHEHLSGFGSDSSIIQNTMESLAFYASKANPDEELRHSPVALKQVVANAYRTASARYLGWMWGLNVSPLGTETRLQVASILTQYFDKQQRRVVRHDDRTNLPVPAGPWIYRLLVAPRTGGKVSNDLSDEHHVLTHIAEVVRHAMDGTKDGAAFKRLFWATAARYSKPREMLDRGRLRSALYDHALSEDPRVCPVREVVTKTVSQIIGTARRHWKLLHPNLIVKEHAFSEGSSALLCLKTPECQPVLWAEGINLRRHGGLRWFHSTLTEREISAHGVLKRNGRWFSLLPLEPSLLGKSIIPPMQVSYEEVADKWVA